MLDDETGSWLSAVWSTRTVKRKFYSKLTGPVRVGIDLLVARV
jgi:hypothetical protein